jgi:hypothetical protein
MLVRAGFNEECGALPTSQENTGAVRFERRKSHIQLVFIFNA